MRSIALSPNAFLESLGSCFVLYNPDSIGMPVVLPESAGRFLSVLRCAVALDEESLTQLEQASGMRSGDAKRCLSICNQLGVLVPGGSPTRNTVPGRHGTPSSSSPRELSVWLHLTNRCNLSCRYCYVKLNQVDASPSDIAETARRIAQAVRKVKARQLLVRLTGGEPSLVPHLIRHVLSHLSALIGPDTALRYQLLTNGTHLPSSFIDYLRENRVSVGISLDGVGTAHDSVRRLPSGQSSFDLVRKGVAALRASDIEPTIMATISEQTVDGLPNLTRWLISEELLASFSFVREFGYAKEDYERFGGRIVTAVKASLEMLPTSRFCLMFLRHLRLAKLSFRHPLRHQPCAIASSHLVFNAQGMLCLCPMTLDRPLRNAGNDLLSALQPHHHRLATAPIDDVCRQCQWLRVCGTGCPVLNEALTGRPNARSPLCSAYCELIPAWIRAYGRQLMRTWMLLKDTTTC